jgi:hypothetical protein
VEELAVGDGADGHAALGGRVAERVLEQVLEDALDHPDVGLDEGQVRGGAGLEPYAPLCGPQLELLHHVLDQLGHGEGLGVGTRLPGVHLRQLEELVDQPAQPLAVPDRGLEILPPLGRGERCLLQGQCLEVAVQRGEGRPQVV